MNVIFIIGKMKGHESRQQRCWGKDEDYDNTSCDKRKHEKVMYQKFRQN